MRIHNLYTDASGQSHFRDIEIEWAEEGRAGKLSRRLPATGIIFREVQPDYDLDWHPAPRRQYIINLDAGVKITASDGEARIIKAGEVILVEDTSGKGHLSQAVEGKIRNCIFVPGEELLTSLISIPWWRAGRAGASGRFRHGERNRRRCD